MKYCLCPRLAGRPRRITPGSSINIFRIVAGCSFLAAANSSAVKTGSESVCNASIASIRSTTTGWVGQWVEMGDNLERIYSELKINGLNKQKIYVGPWGDYLGLARLSPQGVIDRPLQKLFDKAGRFGIARNSPPAPRFKSAVIDPNLRTEIFRDSRARKAV